MTPHDALAEGRLAEAVALQEAAVAATPTDLAHRRLLVDLLAFAGRLDDAAAQLAVMQSDEPEWAETERALHRLFRSERLRSVEGREPQIRPEPPPKHASRRWLALKATRQARGDDAVKCIDAAESVTPELWGFLDGQEFDGIRDADDRFGSVLEVFFGGEYFWYGWEGIRKVTLAPASVLLDQLYRPAQLTLRDGNTLAVHLPLVYPGSHRTEDEFALGTETDYVCPDGGITRCIGAKMLLVGDGAEVPLAECRMIELR